MNCNFLITIVLALMWNAEVASAASTEEKKMETKIIYGEVLTESEYEQMRVNHNPNWIDGEAGIQQRLAQFKKEVDSFSVGEPATKRFAPERMAALVNQASQFHLDSGHLVLTFLPDSIPSGARFTMKSFSLLTVNKEKFETKDPVEGVSSSIVGSKNGKAFKADLLKFGGLPNNLDDSFPSQASATFEIEVDGEYETLKLSKSHPKSGGFELVDLKPDYIRVTFDRPDGYAFSDSPMAKGQPIVSWKISGDLNEIFLA